jgi:hypothetical protein
MMRMIMMIRMMMMMKISFGDICVCSVLQVLLQGTCAVFTFFAYITICMVRKHISNSRFVWVTLHLSG